MMAEKTFAILLKVDGVPLLFSQCVSERFCSPLNLTKELRDCFCLIRAMMDHKILCSFKETGKVDKAVFDNFVSAAFISVLFMRKKKYPLHKKNDQIKVSDFTTKYCPNNPQRITESLRKTKSAKDIFTMSSELMDDALKAADSYAVVNLTNNFEAVLEDFVFLQNDSFESKLSSILDPFDVIELMNYARQNPSKDELINFLSMITVTENHRLKVFNGSVKDNLKVIYDSSEKEKKIPFRIIKTTPYSGNKEVVRVHWPNTISFGTRSVPIFIEKNNGKLNIDFLPHM